jgi:hypothetical protein
MLFRHVSAFVRGDSISSPLVISPQNQQQGRDGSNALQSLSLIGGPIDVIFMTVSLCENPFDPQAIKNHITDTN